MQPFTENVCQLTTENTENRDIGKLFSVSKKGKFLYQWREMFQTFKKKTIGNDQANDQLGGGAYNNQDRLQQRSKTTEGRNQ